MGENAMTRNQVPTKVKDGSGPTTKPEVLPTVDGSVPTEPPQSPRRSVTEPSTLPLKGWTSETAANADGHEHAGQHTDTVRPTSAPQRVEDMSLPKQMALHQQLAESSEPCSMVVQGRLCGLAITMLIDTGAACSLISTKVWDEIHRSRPGLTLVPTSLAIRSVSGERLTARGATIAEVELGNSYYMHRFIVMDLTEDIILGLDFIRRYNVTWNPHGSELIIDQPVSHLSQSDGPLRRLVVAERTIVPANSRKIGRASCRERV